MVPLCPSWSRFRLLQLPELLLLLHHAPSPGVLGGPGPRGPQVQLGLLTWIMLVT